MIETEPLDDRRACDQQSRRLVRLRTGLLAAWLAGTVLIVVLGEHRTPFSHLQRDVSTHSVTTVAIAGEGLLPDDTGSAVQTVHWRDGLIRKYAEVRVQVPDPDSGDLLAGDEIRTLRARDAGVYLAGKAEGLSVTRTQDPNVYGEVHGWRVPVPLSLFFALLMVCALIMLVSGPQPWRATRWAWFWIGLTPFFGPLAYLLLGGRVPLIPAPADRRRRLTGGWAFFIAVCLSPLSGG